MAEDDAERRENARLAQDARMREVAREEIADARAAMWDQFGFSVRDSMGIREIKQTLGGLKAIGIDPTDEDQVRKWAKVIAWISAAHEASVTRNKRILAWIVGLVGFATSVLGLVKFYLDWKH